MFSSEEGAIIDQVVIDNFTTRFQGAMNGRTQELPALYLGPRPRPSGSEMAVWMERDSDFATSFAFALSLRRVQQNERVAGILEEICKDRNEGQWDRALGVAGIIGSALIVCVLILTVVMMIMAVVS